MRNPGENICYRRNPLCAPDGAVVKGRSWTGQEGVDRGGSRGGGGGPGGQSPPPFGGPPNFIKKEKMARVKTPHFST